MSPLGAQAKDATPSSGEPHMAEVRPSGSGFVCFEHDYALPTLGIPVSSGSGCPGSGVAQDQTLCLSTDLIALSGSAQSTVGRSETSVDGGPVLARSDMVLRSGQSASWPSLGGSP